MLATRVPAAVCRHLVHYATASPRCLFTTAHHPAHAILRPFHGPSPPVPPGPAPQNVPAILSQFDRRLQDRAMAALTSGGVDVRINVSVVGVTPTQVCGRVGVSHSQLGYVRPGIYNA